MIDGSYDVVSDAELAGEVSAQLRNTGGFSVDVQPVPEFAALRGQRTVSPLELLLGLGKTTSALPALGRDGAAELPALMALRTTSRWAIIRYLWAFADDRPRLGLSRLTRQVRHHQRALLSEHMGIALATDLVEQVILRTPARVVDADALLYDPYLSRLAPGLGSRRPDYLWHATGDRLSEAVVVEVKGRSAGRAAVVRQLARGVPQVLVPARADGWRLRRLVIGACVNADDSLTAYAIEVPEPTRRLRRVALELMTPRWQRAFDRTAQLMPEEEVLTGIDPGVALEEITGADRVRLLSFAGLQVSLDAASGPYDRIARAAERLVTVEVGEVAYRCERVEIPVGLNRVTLDTGVAADLLDDPNSWSPAGSGFQVFPEADDQQPVRATDAVADRPTSDQVRTRLAVTSPDGCLLALSGPAGVVGRRA